MGIPCVPILVHRAGVVFWKFVARDSAALIGENTHKRMEKTTWWLCTTTQHTRQTWKFRENYFTTCNAEWDIQDGEEAARAYKIIRQLHIHICGCVSLWVCGCGCISAYRWNNNNESICTGGVYAYYGYMYNMRNARDIIFSRIIHLQRLLFQSFARFHAIRVIKCCIGLNRFGENFVSVGVRRFFSRIL